MINLLSLDGSDLAEVDEQRIVEADEPGLPLRLSSHDNLDIQPRSSNTYIIEDTQFGDIWARLPDGADRNERTDGCGALLSITDPVAEPTGFIFNGTGRVAFYNIQHGSQGTCFCISTRIPLATMDHAMVPPMP